MSKQIDYRQDYQKHHQQQTKQPLQTLDIMANICAYIILFSGIYSFVTGLFYTLTTSGGFRILSLTIYLVVSLLIFSLTQMIRVIFKKII
ncbi:MAG: hypothetical protein DWP95_08810 [Proteobacteria bacterium]|nr:MAG: hypothetical protein DWP95_08810 [Pseudomonadota bacterium]